MKNKVLLMIADGLGDRPCEELGWKTPLEAACKENLDRIASWGSSGIMDLWQCGTPVGTDLGHMILFGYGLPDYPGRGPIEAFGEGLELQPGDIALRANFATCRDGLVADRRAGRIRQGTRELAAALDGMQVEDVQVLFKEATEHRAVMVLRGTGLSSAVTDADPKKEGLPIRPVRPRDGSPEAERTARILDRVLVALSGDPVPASSESEAGSRRVASGQCHPDPGGWTDAEAGKDSREIPFESSLCGGRKYGAGGSPAGRVRYLYGSGTDDWEPGYGY